VAASGGQNEPVDQVNGDSRQKWLQQVAGGAQMEARGVMAWGTTINQSTGQEEG